jgi:gamma-glutamyltranspeptidase/glutathione hydrolase
MEPFAIATPEPQATAAGERVLRSGGNAIDAALAAAAVLTVTFPHNCALGGDLFALVRDPGGTTLCINASGPAAAAADAEALRAQYGTMPVQAPEAITVPGLVAGWERLHAAGAALPWRTLFDDAIRLAADGTEVSASLAGAIEEDAAGIAADPGLRAVLMPGGTPLGEGDRLRQPALAASLRELAAGGARVFYDGALGDRLLAGLRRAGSALADVDLHAFAAQACAPLRGRFGELELLTSPPNSQGVVLLQALAALAAADAPDPLGADAGLLAQLLRLGSRQRDAELGDRPLERDAWLAPAAIAARVGQARASVRAAEPQTAPRPGGDTIALVTVDADGRAVSLIQSIYFAFGALLLEPETGIIMHNRGALFSLEPGHPNELAPGRRPLHTLMPVIAERDGELRFVLGAMGGRGQPQILAQVLLRLLAGASPQEAVTAPRWIAGPVEAGDADDAVRVEDGLGDPAGAALAAAGLRVLPEPRFADDFGHAQAIAVAPGRPPEAGSDPRAATAG